MTECECLAVGDRLIESVGLLHSISFALCSVDIAQAEMIFELERLKFNSYLEQVKSLWQQFVIIVREAHDSVHLPLDRVSASLGAIAPL